MSSEENTTEVWTRSVLANRNGLITDVVLRVNGCESPMAEIQNKPVVAKYRFMGLAIVSITAEGEAVKIVMGRK